MLLVWSLRHAESDETNLNVTAWPTGPRYQTVHPPLGVRGGWSLFLQNEMRIDESPQVHRPRR